MAEPSRPKEWPGAELRAPRRRWANYAVRGPLAAWLAAEAKYAADRFGRYRVLDVGCGIKPYYPFFEPYVAEYVGIDVDNPNAELEGVAEALPVPDASYDVVLCTQVLEHATDPAKVVSELQRVLAPGGRALASTHGVQVYHESPVDLWRWTHVGLRRLFEENADWRLVSVTPGSGTAACVGMLLGIYTELVFRRMHLRRLARIPVAAMNVAAEAIDRRVRLSREPGPGTLFANYHVVADS